MKTLFRFLRSDQTAPKFLLVLTFQLGLLPFLFSKLDAQVYNGNLTLNLQADIDAFSGHLTS